MKTNSKNKWAHRYEAAWHQCFWERPEWVQIAIIEDNNCRQSQDLAKDTRLLAEDNNWQPKGDYREIPTGITELKELNNQPF